MKNLALVSTLALAACSHAPVSTAPRGLSDFVQNQPPPSVVPRSLVASDGTRPIAPADVVQFGFDSSELSSAAITQIQRGLDYLSDHPSAKVVLEGHADHSGSSDYNNWMSMRRIDAVRRQLRVQGVPPERIILVAFGDTQAAPGFNAGDRRVVMFTTNQPTPVVVRDELVTQRALSVGWTERGRLNVQGPPPADITER